MIDCDGVDDDEEYRVRVTVTKRGGRARGRLQRHLAAGAHLHQRDARSTRRRRSGSRSSTSSTRRAGSRRAAMRDVDIVHPGGHGGQRAPARRGRLRLLGAEPGDALGAAARAGAGAWGRRRSRATAAAPTSTAPTACGRTARRGSRRPRSAARSAPFGGNRHGDADSQMLSYQANGIGDRRRGGRVRRARGRAAPRARARHRRLRATTAAAPRCCATRSGSRLPSTT